MQGRPIPWRAAGVPGPCGLGRRARTANPPHGHRPNRPGCPRTDPEGLGTASPMPPSGRPRVSSALERALGWDEVMGI